MKGDITVGRRLPDIEYHLLNVGNYARDPREPRHWFARCPNGLIANLSAHTVSEHEDGTISVTPSIEVTGGGKRWHGFLERGIWREED